MSMNKSLNKNVRVGLSLVDNSFTYESIRKKHPMLPVDRSVEGKGLPIALVTLTH